MDTKQLTEFVDSTWDETIVPTLTEYVRIPNKSPLFDPQWQEHGHMERAVDLIEGWCRKREIEGLSVEVVRLEGRTPVIFMEIPGTTDETVLLYGHLDKQPEMTGWSAGLGPWEPVIRDGKLYGRGGADDGYAAFASLTAIEALQRQGIPHARCVVLIEACEESGSVDLPPYIDMLRERIGNPSLVICLDSGAGNYEQLWCTTSLRGIVIARMHVEVISEGVHSGDASGVVPSSFRVARRLLDRIEDPDTGEVLLESAAAPIPDARVVQAQAVAGVLGSQIFERFPWHPGVRATGKDLTQLVLNRTWRPALSITGADGLPKPADAGNVMRPVTTLVLSLRVAPTSSVDEVAAELKRTLEADPPYGAKVTVDVEDGGAGWEAPALAPWLEEAARDASQACFGKDAMYMGEGGSIPFMGMLGEKFPEAQFMITGVLGPKSNAHGPNEFLHISMGKRLTAAMSHVLAHHHKVFGA